MQILIIPKDLYCPDGTNIQRTTAINIYMKPDCTNRKNIPSTCGTTGFLNHPQYDWSVKFLNASPPKIIFLGLVPPRKHCMRADYDTLHCRLDLLGIFKHLCDINPARIPYYSTAFLLSLSPPPQKNRNFFPSQFCHRFFFSDCQATFGQTQLLSCHCFLGKFGVTSPCVSHESNGFGGHHSDVLNFTWAKVEPKPLQHFSILVGFLGSLYPFPPPEI